MNTCINCDELSGGRRDFIKKLCLGSAGLALGALELHGCSTSMQRALVLKRTAKLQLGDSRVSFVTGNDRRQMIYEALKPFENEISEGIQDKQVIIKVNFMGTGNPLSTTHPDAVRGVLDFLTPLYDRPIIVGESKGFLPSFEHYGYYPLRREYNVRLVELHEGPNTYQWILDQNLYPTSIRVINSYLDPNNYIISVTRLKTHNVVVATLTLKNVVMGSPLKIPKVNINDKDKMHAGNETPKFLNYNLFVMAHRVYPDFAVLDGFEGMEGDGPGSGDPVDHKVAIAGSDCVSVDRIGTELMGIPWENIGYLQYCARAGLGQGDRSRIKVIGPDPEDYIIKYKLHSNIEWQYTWKKDVIMQR